jgi:hypothetical protein
MVTMGPFGKIFMAIMVAMSAFGAVNGGTIVGSRVAGKFILLSIDTETNIVITIYLLFILN